MRLVCPNCAAAYEVADDAIGPNGRKVRCRACGTSWFEAPAVAPPLVAERVVEMPETVSPPVMSPRDEPAESAAAEVVAAEEAIAAPSRRRLRVPLLAFGLVVLVLLLGIAVAILAFGPQRVATGLGIAERRVPLGIAITRQPDWRMIAGGSELFAVSGRIWNPTAETQAVPDIRAELKDRSGRTVYAWTIDAPVARIAPGRAIDFDGAAMDVPRASARVAVSFVGTRGK